MRVLITGATGLVGSNITKLCHQKEIKVNYLTTSNDKIENRPDYQGFYWNIETREIDVNCFKDVDAIIHLAGAPIAKRWTSSYKKEIIESRTQSADLLFETLQNSGFKIPKFISASAIGIYPSSFEKLYFEDDKSVDDSFLGEVVVKWEASADRFKDLEMEVAKIRIGLVLAREGGAFPKLLKPVSLNVGTAFGSGKQWQSWIHIDDLAGIFLHILENKLSGVYNAVAPNAVTNEKLMKEIAAQLDKSIWLPNAPAFALKIALGEMATVLLSSQLISSDKIEKSGFEFHYKNLTKALEDLI
jgi:hypothetical protein